MRTSKRLLKRLGNAAMKLLPAILTWEIIRGWVVPSSAPSLNLFLPSFSSSQQQSTIASTQSSRENTTIYMENSSRMELSSPRQEPSTSLHSSTQLLLDTRNCTSPENDVTWPMGRCENPFGRSRTSPRTCGVCSNNTDNTGYLLSELAEVLKTYKEATCKGLIVYSVAFGQSFSTLFNRTYAIKRRVVKEMLNIHNRCFITFMLHDANSTSAPISVSASKDHLNTLVHFQPHLLPYRSYRRNVKLFKMNPHYLFPWAEYVVFQDAKFRKRFKLFERPVNYYHHVNRTLKATQTCASFQTIPYHKLTMDPVNLPLPSIDGPEVGCPNHVPLPNETGFCQEDISLAQHCAMIVKSSLHSRPNVTDDVSNLLSQCMLYLTQYGSSNGTFAQNSTSNGCYRENNEEPRPVYQMYPYPAPALDHNLIDSALLAWNFQSHGCLDWIADLLCTWMDEIHCFSDRDQISFPYAVAKMDRLRLVHGKHTQTTHRVLADARRPRIFFMKGHCSWMHHHCYERRHPWHRCKMDVPSNRSYFAQS